MPKLSTAKSQSSTTNKNSVTPILKWAGGKRWLVESHPEIFSLNYNRLIEPFMGSGAVFFKLAPDSSIISDSNQELISTYEAIRNDWLSVETALKRHHSRHSKAYYYKMRDTKPRTPHGRAARFIYLNRTCWNGLYRVNLQGKFNVPIGTKTNVLLETDNFKKVSELLEKAELDCCDFEKTIDKAQKGDLLFVDPPYTVKHNQNGFIKYNESLFSWEDQVRLKEAIIRAKNRSARIILTNAHHESIIELYKGIGTQSPLTRSSVISGIAKHRGAYEELLVVC